MIGRSGVRIPPPEGAHCRCVLGQDTSPSLPPLSLALLWALCVFEGRGQRQDPGQGARIQVQFTPTVCKVRCVQGRCVNLCDRGEVTTVYSSDGGRGAEQGNAFRVCEYQRFRVCEYQRLQSL
uniref:Uncharacterized protein n=1 Tax=Neogobius melanostomus TaxID=47308 RepID=A0A8C6T8D3_9GOBI